MVVDEEGKLIVDNVYNGFDQTVIQRIKDDLNLPQPAREPVRQENPAPASVQKDRKHGGHSWSPGMDGKPKHNPADGRQKPIPPKGKNCKLSVLAKLYQKQAELTKRNEKSVL